MNKLMTKGATMLASVVLATGGVVALSAPAAQAATVRPGAQWGQVDVLMDWSETERVRRDWWAATVICWQSGLGGKIALGYCVPQISICAANAYYKGKRAGTTFGIGSSWCWTY